MRIIGGTRPMSWEEMRDAFVDVRGRRRRLACIRAELLRMDEKAKYANIVGAHWRHEQEREAVRELGRAFEPGPLESARAEIFDEIAQHPSLAKDMGIALDEATAWNAGAHAFAARARARPPTERDIDERAREAQVFGQRVSFAIAAATRALDELLGRA